jgi:hypothetical protein
MYDLPFDDEVVILRTLPMLEMEPSTFCAIWVSISVGAAPGCEC